MHKCPVYDTKQSNGEIAAMLEICWTQSAPTMPSLSYQLWPSVLAPDRVLSMGQIELNYVLMLNWIDWNKEMFWHLNCELMINWIVWNRSVYKIETAFTLNWIVWIRTVWLK